MSKNISLFENAAELYSALQNELDEEGSVDQNDFDIDIFLSDDNNKEGDGEIISENEKNDENDQGTNNGLGDDERTLSANSNRFISPLIDGRQERSNISAFLELTSDLASLTPITASNETQIKPSSNLCQNEPATIVRTSHLILSDGDSRRLYQGSDPLGIDDSSQKEFLNSLDHLNRAVGLDLFNNRDLRIDSSSNYVITKKQTRKKKSDKKERVKSLCIPGQYPVQLAKQQELLLSPNNSKMIPNMINEPVEEPSTSRLKQRPKNVEPYVESSRLKYLFMHLRSYFDIHHRNHKLKNSENEKSSTLKKSFSGCNNESLLNRVISKVPTVTNESIEVIDFIKDKPETVNTTTSEIQQINVDTLHDIILQPVISSPYTLTKRTNEVIDPSKGLIKERKVSESDVKVSILPSPSEESILKEFTSNVSTAIQEPKKSKTKSFNLSPNKKSLSQPRYKNACSFTKMSNFQALTKSDRRPEKSILKSKTTEFITTNSLCDDESILNPTISNVCSVAEVTNIPQESKSNDCVQPVEQYEVSSFKPVISDVRSLSEPTRKNQEYFVVEDPKNVVHSESTLTSAEALLAKISHLKHGVEESSTIKIPQYFEEIVLPKDIVCSESCINAMWDYVLIMKSFAQKSVDLGDIDQYLSRLKMFAQDTNLSTFRVSYILGLIENIQSHPSYPNTAVVLLNFITDLGNVFSKDFDVHAFTYFEACMGLELDMCIICSELRTMGVFLKFLNHFAVHHIGGFKRDLKLAYSVKIKEVLQKMRKNFWYFQTFGSCLLSYNIITVLSGYLNSMSAYKHLSDTNSESDHAKKQSKTRKYTKITFKQKQKEKIYEAKKKKHAQNLIQDTLCPPSDNKSKNTTSISNTIDGEMQDTLCPSSDNKPKNTARISNTIDGEMQDTLCPSSDNKPKNTTRISITIDGEMQDTLCPSANKKPNNTTSIYNTIVSLTQDVLCPSSDNKSKNITNKNSNEMEGVLCTPNDVNTSTPQIVYNKVTTGETSRSEEDCTMKVTDEFFFRTNGAKCTENCNEIPHVYNEHCSLYFQSKICIELLTKIGSNQCLTCLESNRKLLKFYNHILEDHFPHLEDSFTRYAFEMFFVLQKTKRMLGIHQFEPCYPYQKSMRLLFKTLYGYGKEDFEKFGNFLVALYGKEDFENLGNILVTTSKQLSWLVNKEYKFMDKGSEARTDCLLSDFFYKMHTYNTRKSITRSQILNIQSTQDNCYESEDRKSQSSKLNKDTEIANCDESKNRNPQSSKVSTDTEKSKDRKPQSSKLSKDTEIANCDESKKRNPQSLKVSTDMEKGKDRKPQSAKVKNDKGKGNCDKSKNKKDMISDKSTSKKKLGDNDVDKRILGILAMAQKELEATKQREREIAKLSEIIKPSRTYSNRSKGTLDRTEIHSQLLANTEKRLDYFNGVRKTYSRMEGKDQSIGNVNPHIHVSDNVERVKEIKVSIVEDSQEDETAGKDNRKPFDFFSFHQHDQVITNAELLSGDICENKDISEKPLKELPTGLNHLTNSFYVSEHNTFALTNNIDLQHTSDLNADESHTIHVDFNLRATVLFEPIRYNDSLCPANLATYVAIGQKLWSDRTEPRTEHPIEERDQNESKFQEEFSDLIEKKFFKPVISDEFLVAAEMSRAPRADTQSFKRKADEDLTEGVLKKLFKPVISDEFLVTEEMSRAPDEDLTEVVLKKMRVEGMTQVGSGDNNSGFDSIPVDMEKGLPDEISTIKSKVDESVYMEEHWITCPKRCAILNNCLQIIHGFFESSLCTGEMLGFEVSRVFRQQDDITEVDAQILDLILGEAELMSGGGSLRERASHFLREFLDHQRMHPPRIIFITPSSLKRLMRLRAKNRPLVKNLLSCRLQVDKMTAALAAKGGIKLSEEALWKMSRKRRRSDASVMEKMKNIIDFVVRNVCS